MRTLWRNRITGFLGLFLILSLSELLGVFFAGTWLAQPMVRLLWAAALALGAVAVVEATRRRGAHLLRAFYDLARRQRHPLDVQAVLDTGLTRAVLLSGAAAGCLRLLEPDGSLAIAASMHTHPQYLKRYRRVQPREDVLFATLRSAQPAYLWGDSLPEEITALPLTGEVRAAIIAPLVADGRVCGLMTVVYRSRLKLLRDELDTLRVLGAQLGSSVANARSYEELVQESQTDPLTGVSSRRHFEEQFRRELSRARRNRRPLSLAMLDVDHLKQINDIHGHVAGDLALRTVGEILREVRGGDVAARYGGDEFVILMPDTDSDSAVRALARIQERVHQINAESRLPFTLSVSVGVRELGAPDDDLVAQADAEMYRDKQRKRRDDDLLCPQGRR